MAALILTTAQPAFMTSMEQPFLDSFGDGIVLPGGTPSVVAGFKGFKDYSAEMKLNSINAIKSTFAPLVSLLVKEPETYNTISSEFMNGFAVWGDPNYGNGLLRYAKDSYGFRALYHLYVELGQNVTNRDFDEDGVPQEVLDYADNYDTRAANS